MAAEQPDQIRAELENTLRDLDLVVRRLEKVVELVLPQLRDIAARDEQGKS